MFIGRTGITAHQSALLTECFNKERSLAARWSEQYKQEQAAIADASRCVLFLFLETLFNAHF